MSASTDIVSPNDLGQQHSQDGCGVGLGCCVVIVLVVILVVAVLGVMYMQHKQNDGCGNVNITLPKFTNPFRRPPTEETLLNDNGDGTMYEEEAATLDNSFGYIGPEKENAKLDDSAPSMQSFMPLSMQAAMMGKGKAKPTSEPFEAMRDHEDSDDGEDNGEIESRHKSLARYMAKMSRERTLPHPQNENRDYNLNNHASVGNRPSAPNPLMQSACGTDPASWNANVSEEWVRYQEEQCGSRKN